MSKATAGKQIEILVLLNSPISECTKIHAITSLNDEARAATWRPHRRICDGTDMVSVRETSETLQYFVEQAIECTQDQNIESCRKR